MADLSKKIVPKKVPSDYEKVTDPKICQEALSVITNNPDFTVSKNLSLSIEKLISQKAIFLENPKAIVRNGDSLHQREQNVIIKIDGLKGISLKCRYTASAWEDLKKSDSKNSSIKKVSADLQLRFDLWVDPKTLKFLQTGDRTVPLKKLATAVEKQELGKLAGTGLVRLFFALADTWHLYKNGSKNQKKILPASAKEVVTDVLKLTDLPDFDATAAEVDETTLVEDESEFEPSTVETTA